MTRTINHALRGEWHSSDAALHRLAKRLRRKGAGKGATLRFSGELPHGGADAVTLIDLTYFVGADAVELPALDPYTRRRWMSELRTRAARWNVRISPPR